MENHLAMKLGQLVDIVMRNIFRKYFPLFGVLRPKARYFFQLQTYPNQTNVAQCCVSCRNQYDWFLYEIELWAKMVLSKTN